MLAKLFHGLVVELGAVVCGEVLGCRIPVTESMESLSNGFRRFVRNRNEFTETREVVNKHENMPVVIASRAEAAEGVARYLEKWVKRKILELSWTRKKLMKEY